MKRLHLDTPSAATVNDGDLRGDFTKRSVSNCAGLWNLAAAASVAHSKGSRSSLHRPGHGYQSAAIEYSGCVIWLHFHNWRRTGSAILAVNHPDQPFTGPHACSCGGVGEGQEFSAVKKSPRSAAFSHCDRDPFEKHYNLPVFQLNRFGV